MRRLYYGGSTRELYGGVEKESDSSVERDSSTSSVEAEIPPVNRPSSTHEISKNRPSATPHYLSTYTEISQNIETNTAEVETPEAEMCENVKKCENLIFSGHFF